MNQMRVPFGTITITDKAKKLINKLLDDSRISQGNVTKLFEREFASKIGTRGAVAVSSGTDAISIALSTFYDFGVSRGDEVIVPALSFISSASAILHAGFRPVFVDIKRDTLTVDVDKLESVLTRRTFAVLPVHLMGKPARMKDIVEFANTYGLKIVEDCAEAYGTYYGGQHVGTFGDMGTFSTYIAHVVTTGEGGIVVSNRDEYLDILRSLRAHGRACNCEICLLSTNSRICKKRFDYKGQDIRFMFDRIGYSSKMNELEAAIGLGSLDIYDTILNKRRENFWYLHQLMKEFENYFYLPTEEVDEKIGPHAFPIVLREKVGFSRNDLMIFMEEHGVETRTLFASIPTQYPAFEFMGIKEGSFPEAEFVGKNGLHIGVHQGLGKKEMEYVVDVINKFLKKCG